MVGMGLGCECLTHSLCLYPIGMHPSPYFSFCRVRHSYIHAHDSENVKYESYISSFFGPPPEKKCDCEHSPSAFSFWKRWHICNANAHHHTTLPDTVPFPLCCGSYQLTHAWGLRWNVIRIACEIRKENHPPLPSPPPPKSYVFVCDMYAAFVEMGMCVRLKRHRQGSRAGGGFIRGGGKRSWMREQREYI